jgi:hypothetical protein
MLRITVHDNPRALTFQLEGRLAGPWLRELEACWHSALACRRRAILRVDLTGVTFIDAEGKACLAALHRQGAEFVAADCLTKAVVAEITQGPLPEGACPRGKGDSAATEVPREDHGGTSCGPLQSPKRAEPFACQADDGAHAPRPNEVS